MATSNAKSREGDERESSVPAQVLYDRSRTSGIELFKHLRLDGRRVVLRIVGALCQRQGV